MKKLKNMCLKSYFSLTSFSSHPILYYIINISIINIIYKYKLYTDKCIIYKTYTIF